MKFFTDWFKKKPKIEPIQITKRFDLVSRVGQGSMSKVWRARDTKTGKTAALKVLDKEKTLRFESRFKGLTKPTEGEIAIQLQHEHIVRTYDHGMTVDGEQWLVMDFIEGVAMSFLVDMQNKMMQQHRLKFLIEIGEAIAYLHENKWIHRDICPRNILVDEDCDIKLIDYGLVVPNIEKFCRPGNRTGTAMYMAPELIKRQKTDHRIDIFSYAITCFEMYTQEKPWDAGHTLEAILQHINQPANDIHEFIPDLDEQVAKTIMRGLETDPRDRWKKVSEMVTEFRAAAKRLGVSPYEKETSP
jgi:serine/threonine protein kinase